MTKNNAEHIKLTLTKRRSYALIGSLLLGAGVYWLVITLSATANQAAGPSNAVPKLSITATGKVQSPVVVEVNSKIKGKVLLIPVVEGQPVHAGQTLIILENKERLKAIESARSLTKQAEARFKKINELTQAGSAQSLHRAQSSLDNAKLQYARTIKLAEKNMVGREQVSDALRNLAIAQSQLANVKFQVQANRAKGSDYALAEQALNKARANEKVVREKSDAGLIKAETDGKLISRLVDQGKQVVAGQVLMAISPTGKVRLIVQVNARDLHFLKIGQHAKVLVNADKDKIFDAEIAYINPVMDTLKSVVEVMLNVASPPEYLRPEMPVSVDIDVADIPGSLFISALAT